MKSSVEPINADAQMNAAGSYTSALFDYDQFQVNRKILSIAGKYHVLDGNGNPVCYVDRPLLKVKAQFGVFTDDSKARKIMTLQQDSLIAINMKCSLLDENEQLIATFERKGFMSMIRRTWIISDAAGKPVAKAMEDSLVKALFRRFLGKSPLGFVFRTNFILTKSDETPLGDFIRAWSLKDNHVLDLSGDSARHLDRRIAVGIAILLDNMEPHDA